MAAFGTITLYALLLLGTWTGALALVGARRRNRALTESARLALYAAAGLASLALLALTYALAASDFSLTYVHRYSERAMPLFYKLTAVWGGQEGSLLLWTWLLAVLAAWSVHVNRERLRELIPWVILVLMTVLVFFVLLLLLTGNPFDTFLGPVPQDGRGLNPLLQNAYMVTHPPALYLGYVGMTIPFAFALGALLSGQTDARWIHAARPWALASWYSLTLGLVLGMLWAYEELGWGGYWAWDPVENAALFPWLTASAYLHSVMVQERRQMLKVWNIVLAALTFELTLFGTFLTRSGVIQSVHAFAQSEMGTPFLGFMALVLLVTLVLIVWRWPALRSAGELESVLSREFIFVINNWILLSAAFLVVVLTLFPAISQLLGSKVTISAPAFNRWMIPPGLTLLFLKGFGPMMGWRQTTAAGLRRQLLLPLALLAATMVTLFPLGVREPIPLLTFGLCALVLGAVLQELYRGVRLRMRGRGPGEGADPLTALLGLVGRNRRRYGGYVVHVGIALMFIGFGGEAYKQEGEFLLTQGQRATLGRYVLRYDGIKVERDAQREMLVSTLSIFREGERVGIVRPARWIYFKHQDQPTTEVDIRRSAREDLFVVLGAYEEGTGVATFKIIVNPLVNWIWIGFVLLSLGTLIAIFPAGARRGRALPAATALLVLVLAGAAVDGAWASDPPSVSPGGAAPAATAPSPALTPGTSGTHPPTSARTESTPPVDPAIERRLFTRLACMCPTCPRIPLATCQCGFAGTERDAIRRKLHAGWSEERVLRWYLEGRGPELGREPFGAAALTVPPDSGFHRLSWLLPYALSGLAALGLLAVGRRWVRRSRASRSRLIPAGAASSMTPLAGESDRQPGSTTERQTYEQLLERELRKLD